MKGGEPRATCSPITLNQRPNPKTVRRPTTSMDPDRERLLDGGEEGSPSEPTFVPVFLLPAHNILRLTNIRTLAAQLGQYTP